MLRDGIGGGNGGIESVLNCSVVSCCIPDMDICVLFKLEPGDPV